jgi:hypothetical protein
MGFESPVPEAGENPFGVFSVVRGSDVVGPRAEPPHEFADVGRIRDRAELRLPLALRLAGARRVTSQGSLVRAKSQGWKNQASDQQHRGESAAFDSFRRGSCRL